MTLRRALALGVSFIALSGFARTAYADPALPNLPNLDFTSYSGSAPKASFTNVDPAGWTGGTQYDAIDSTAAGQGAASNVNPNVITTYGNPTGSYSGNYVQADGNPTFQSGFYYTVTGLTVGTTYTLSFYQGASEQDSNSFFANTTNQWVVSLATSQLYTAAASTPTTADSCTNSVSTCVYSNADATASIEASPLMTVPAGSTVGFNYVSLNLTADASTDILSFLAWGDGGSTANTPPIAFLAGVDAPTGLGAQVPEPASLSILAAGLVALGGVVQHRRKKVATTA